MVFFSSETVSPRKCWLRSFNQVLVNSVPAFSDLRAHPDSSGTQRDTFEDNLPWLETAITPTFSMSHAQPDATKTHTETVTANLSWPKTIVVPAFSEFQAPVWSLWCLFTNDHELFTVVSTGYRPQFLSYFQQDSGPHHATLPFLLDPRWKRGGSNTSTTRSGVTSQNIEMVTSSSNPKRSRSRVSQTRVSIIECGSSRKVLSLMLLRPSSKKSPSGFFRPNRLPRRGRSSLICLGLDKQKLFLAHLSVSVFIPCWFLRFVVYRQCHITSKAQTCFTLNSSLYRLMAIRNHRYLAASFNRKSSLGRVCIRSNIEVFRIQATRDTGAATPFHPIYWEHATFTG